MKNGRQLKLAAFVLVVVAYAAARAWRLTDSCLWFDETFSIHAAEHSWDSLFNFVALDLIHPPLFYVLLKLWIGVGGESLFWLRLFPVVFSVIAIFPFISLCRELKLGKWTQLLALLLFAVNGSLIKYAQEVRMYSLLLCLSLFSMWLFARYFQKGKSFVPLVIVNILMVYSHYFGWFVVSSEVAAILVFQRIKWRRIVTMFAIILASFVPWVVTVWLAARSGSELAQNIGWMSRPGPLEIGGFVLNLIEPFYYQASSAEPVSIFRVSLPILLIAVVAIALYFAGWKQQNENERRRMKLLVLFVALPLAIAFAASWLLPYSIWGTRHLIIVFAPVSLLLAIALTKISTGTIRTAAFTLIFLFTGYAFLLEALRPKPQFSWCAWEPLAEEWILTPHYLSTPKTVYALEELVGYHIWFAARNFPNNNVSVVKGFGGTAEDAAYFLPRGFHKVKFVDPATAFSGPEFWVAFRDPDPDYGVPGHHHRSPRPLIELSRLGYEAEDTKKIRVGNESVFLTRLIRRPPNIP